MLAGRNLQTGKVQGNVRVKMSKFAAFKHLVMFEGSGALAAGLDATATNKCNNRNNWELRN